MGLWDILESGLQVVQCSKAFKGTHFIILRNGKYWYGGIYKVVIILLLIYNKLKNEGYSGFRGSHGSLDWDKDKSNQKL